VADCEALAAHVAAAFKVAAHWSTYGAFRDGAERCGSPPVLSASHPFMRDAAAPCGNTGSPSAFTEECYEFTLGEGDRPCLAAAAPQLHTAHVDDCYEFSLGDADRPCLAAAAPQLQGLVIQP
jgi:hypothetical protein